MQRSDSANQQALMQRSDSASEIRMRRSRRRMLGLTTAVAVHLLAVAALLPVARVEDRPPSSDAEAPVTMVQLVHLRPPPREVPAQAPQPPQPQDAPKSKAASLPDAPATFEVALADPESPGPSPPARPEDDDPLYRVPFRDAVAQADARLRAGLGCAHVDLDQLPKTTLELCQAAAGLRPAASPGRPKRGPLG
jgi:hypothetical protein